MDNITNRFWKRKAIGVPEEVPEPKMESIPVPNEYSMESWVFKMNDPISYLWNMYNIDLSNDPEWSQLNLDQDKLKSAIATIVEIYQRAEDQIMGPGWKQNL